jgi:hypothetical protein
MKIQTGIYKHYKGQRYLVIGLARHSETEEPFVVYIPLDKRNPKDQSEHQRLCIRPLKGSEGFTDVVDMPKYKWHGPRFKLETPIDFGVIPK